jgi:hypothetical protein
MAWHKKLKVNKYQKHSFLKLHCPKKEQNIRQNSALALSNFIGRILSDISCFFLANGVSRKNAFDLLLTFSYCLVLVTMQWSKKLVSTSSAEQIKGLI